MSEEPKLTPDVTTPEQGKEPEKEVTSNSPTAIEAATALAERIDAGNAKAEELLQRKEALLAEQMLGGQSEAGQIPEKPKVETDKEYAERIVRGDFRGEEGKND